MPDEEDDEFDEEIIVSNLESIYDELVNIQDDYGYNKNTILFLNYNLEQLVDLYYEYDMIYVIKFLNQYEQLLAVRVEVERERRELERLTGTRISAETLLKIEMLSFTISAIKFN